MVIDNIAFLSEGKQHQVYDGGDGTVIKVPKTSDLISFQQAQRSVSFFQSEFGQFVPKTEILPSNSIAPYFVVQKKVEGILLCDFLQNQGMSYDVGVVLIQFMRRVIDVLDKKNIGFDIIGTPPNENFQGKWEGCTNIIIPYSNDTMSFIDTVTFSMRMGRSDLVNKIKRFGCYASYMRQRARYVALLKDLECKMKNI